jgi:hypothetical protein
MKKINSNDELRPEYKREDLGKGKRGVYFKSYEQGHNLVLLKPEIAKAFPTEEAVNNALLLLIEVTQNTAVHTGHSGR